MSESTATITINLTLEEADFICGALVEYRYENYARKALDKTMIYPDFLKLYLRLWERIVSLMPPAIDPVRGHGRNRTKYGRRRKLK